MEQETQKRLAEVQTWLQGEFASIRTGQASPALLDSVKAENYGTLMPLTQMSNIGVEDARTLRITPWDISQIPTIEKALQEADLGVSVATDSAGVRAMFPELTVERRAQLQKLAKTKLEEARIRIRAIRDDAMKVIEKQEKDGDISEDDKFTAKDTIQEKIDTMNKNLETMYTKKETELES
jgi:ribosome recycling factor